MDKILELCTARDTISSVYAADPSKSPGEIACHLYGSNHLDTKAQTPPLTRHAPDSARLEWALRCGKFGDVRPSELFLAAYADILQCLEHDPLANCCSPALCGSLGVVPMTVIAPLHDQTRHMSNIIARARREVLLATNFWKASDASTFLTDGLRELSKRAGARGERVVVKLMFDRGDIQQVFENHQEVSVKGMLDKNVHLPAPDEIPHLDLAVVNFHRPPLGTFHCKFMVVDRQIALVSSNNVQDNDNLEMMSQLEGPIVDSLWETFLVSWHNKLNPELPCRNTTAASAPPPTYAEPSFQQLFTPDGKFRRPEQNSVSTLAEHMPRSPNYDDTIAGEIERMRSVLNPREGETHADTVARHLNQPTKLSLKATAEQRPEDLNFFPFIPVPPSSYVPIAMASRKPYANLNNKSAYVPQNEAFLSLIRNAKRTIFIQTPDLNAKSLLPELIAACRRGIEITYYVCLGYNDTGELLPGQGGTNEMAANFLLKELNDTERERLKIFFYVAADQIEPIHNEFKKRSCHIKLMIADEQVAIQGSGNQDTQSWYHSQEVNVMIDSPVVCRQWREGIERNQNTARYGRVHADGCWYDQHGELAKGSRGTKKGAFSWASGAIGMLKKAQGK